MLALYSLILGLTLISLLVSLLLVKKKYWLALFCLCNVLYQGLVILDALPTELPVSLYFIFLTSLFIPGPALLGMASIGINQRLISYRDFFSLFIPALIVLVWYEFLAESGANLAATEQSSFYLSLFEFIAIVATLHTLGYVCLTLYLLYKHKRSWRNNRGIFSISHRMFVILVLAFSITVLGQAISAYTYPTGHATSFGDAIVCIWLCFFNSTLFYHAYIGISKKNLTPKLPLASIKESRVANTSNIDKDFLFKVTNLIEDNFSNAHYSTNDMATDLFLSSRQLQRKMQTNLETTPKEFIKRFRLEKARELLEKPDMQITSIAYGVGFSSPAYFALCFKEAFEKTPSQFRKEANNQKISVQ